MKKKSIILLAVFSVAVLCMAFLFLRDSSAPEITTIEFSERTPGLPGVADNHFKKNKSQVSAFKIKKSDNIKFMSVKTYELVDSKWEPVRSSGYSLDDSRTSYTLFSCFDSESGQYQEILKGRDVYETNQTMETVDKNVSKFYVNHIYSCTEAPAGVEIPVLTHIYFSGENEPVVHFGRFDEPEIFNRVRADKLYITTVTFSEEFTE